VKNPVRLLSDPVRFVRGVGPVRESMLSRLEVRTAEDLLYFFPFRYEDRRNILPLSALRGGDTASVAARVVAF